MYIQSHYGTPPGGDRPSILSVAASTHNTLSHAMAKDTNDSVSAPPLTTERSPLFLAATPIEMTRIGWVQYQPRETPP